MANKFWVGGALNTNWSENTAGNTNWAATSGGLGTATIPTTSDDVFFDVNSNTLGTSVLNTAFTIKSLDCTGYTGSLTHATATTLTVSGAGVVFKLVSAMTYTLGNASSSAITFTGASGTTTITTAGKTLGALIFGSSGTWQLQDNLTISATASLTLSQGTLDPNGKTIDCGIFGTNSASTKVLSLGSATIICRSGGNAWSIAGTLLTFTAGSSTITLTRVGGAQTFIGNGLTYNNVSFSGGGSGTVAITGANTFNNLSLGSAKTYTFTNGVTYTFTTLTGVGSSGNLVTIVSASAGNAFTFSCASGTVSCDWLSLKDSTATGGASFYAGANSTNVSGNTGWTFTAAPSGGGAMMMGIG